MQKQRIVRTAAALGMGALVAVALVWVGARDTVPSLTYNELLVLAGDMDAASSALQDWEASSGLANEVGESKAVSALEIVLERIAAEERRNSQSAAASEEGAAAEADGGEDAASSDAEEPGAESESTASSEASSSSAASSHAQSETHSASSSHTASSHPAASEASGAAASSSKTADELCDEKLAGYIRQIEQLQARSEKRLYSIMLSAYNDYMAKPANERNLVTKVSVVLSKSSELNKVQNECDAEFNQIVKEMRQTLRENGRDETLADEAERTYKQKKNAMNN